MLLTGSDFTLSCRCRLFPVTAAAAAVLDADGGLVGVVLVHGAVEQVGGAQAQRCPALLLPLSGGSQSLVQSILIILFKSSKHLYCFLDDIDIRGLSLLI